MGQVYLVRYGLMGHVGRFLAAGPTYARGDRVVIRSRRGTELGEILAPGHDASGTGESRIVRSADAADMAMASHAAIERLARLAACERVFREGVWPLELLDVEPMLEPSRTVLYYLGPHRLDAEGLREALRTTCGLEVVFEASGRDEPVESGAGCGSCGTGGGCGTGGCGGQAEHGKGGCSGCVIPGLVSRRRSAAVF
jgi:hypothetical protein